VGSRDSNALVVNHLTRGSRKSFYLGSPSGFWPKYMSEVSYRAVTKKPIEERSLSPFSFLGQFYH
jgi:hypothetical protein